MGARNRRYSLTRIYRGWLLEIVDYHDVLWKLTEHVSHNATMPTRSALSTTSLLWRVEF